jgi:hypothetical protein
MEKKIENAKVMSSHGVSIDKKSQSQFNFHASQLNNSIN